MLLLFSCGATAATAAAAAASRLMHTTNTLVGAYTFAHSASESPP